MEHLVKKVKVSSRIMTALIVFWWTDCAGRLFIQYEGAFTLTSEINRGQLQILTKLIGFDYSDNEKLGLHIFSSKFPCNIWFYNLFRVFLYFTLKFDLSCLRERLALDLIIQKKSVVIFKEISESDLLNIIHCSLH